MSPVKNDPSSGKQHAILAERVFDGHRWHAQAAVMIRDGRVAGIGSWNELAKDWPQTQLQGATFLAPGFIDLQVNGGGGVLLNDQPTADSMRAIARAHRRFGTTACLPTLITDTRERVQAAIAAARSVSSRDGVIGLHLEGPFISPKRPGVHRPDRIVQPVAGDLEQLCELAGAGQSMVTLAPECVPAGFVRTLAASGVRVSIGHSEASAATVMQAVADGATGITHLFNAMPPLSAREPGIVGAALYDEETWCGIIVDGHHVDPIMLKLALRCKRHDRFMLVTDAMPAVGCAEPTFVLQGRTIRVVDGICRDENGTLAGTALDMAAAVRNAVSLLGLDIVEAARMASEYPAEFLGLGSELGRIAPGYRANLVLMNDDLEVQKTWIEGVASV